MFNRILMGPLQELAQQFPAIVITGPRQSGKTTLAKMAFPDYGYITLEDIDKKMAAQEDPKDFLAAYSHGKGLIIDEAQEVPELLSYLQGIIDQSYRPGFYILTGSQNFLLHEKITQTLAGRVAMLTLLPLSLDELQQSNILPESLEFLLIKGCYPRIYDQPIPAKIWYSNYITTYVEKDVRKIINIADLNAFQRFLKLCAARVGNLLNYASLARDCDVSPNTVKAWISLLEASYIIFLMYPYSKNFNKRIIKAPKLYFYDSGLVCSLLNIRSTEELSLSAIRGALFESYIISEIYKYNYHRAERPALYFWRDVQGHEIDCIIEQSIDVLIPIEIKAQKTMNDSFFKGLVDWNTITGYADGSSYVIYTGDEVVRRKKGYVYRWEKLVPLLHTIYKR